MRLTLFGALWILICFFALFSSKKWIQISVLLWSCIFQANAVFIIQENDISSLSITCFIFNIVFCLNKIIYGFSRNKRNLSTIFPKENNRKLENNIENARY